MKKILIMAMICTSVLSCKKEDSSSNGNNTSECSTFPYRKGTSVTLTSSSGTDVTNVYSKDTTIAGQYYIGTVATSLLGTTTVSWSGLTANQEVISYLKPIGDLPTINMIGFKLKSPVGATWNYTYPSVSTPTVSYKYTYTIVSNSETFSFGGKNYTNGQKIKIELTILMAGTVLSTSTAYSTYCCGIGTVKTEDNSNIRTLTAYTY